MKTKTETKCAACGASFTRSVILAMLIDLGAHTQDPNICPATDDNEHDWRTEAV